MSEKPPELFQTQPKRPASLLQRGLGQRGQMSQHISWEEHLALGLQIAEARQMETQLQPCWICGHRVTFHFLNPPDATALRGYMLCPHYKMKGDYLARTSDEIVAQWNNGPKAVH